MKSLKLTGFDWKLLSLFLFNAIFQKKFEGELADERRKFEALEAERQVVMDECVLLRTQNEEAAKVMEAEPQFCSTKRNLL